MDIGCAGGDGGLPWMSRAGMACGVSSGAQGLTTPQAEQDPGTTRGDYRCTLVHHGHA
jgi:hypothetical protein